MTTLNFLTRCAAGALAATLASTAAAWPQTTDSRSPLAVAAASEGAAAVQLWHAAARDAIARRKPNQQAALRWLALLASAQQRGADGLASAGGPVSEAAWSALFDRVSAEMLAALVPADAEEFRRLAAALALTRRASAGSAEVARAEQVAGDAVQATLARAARDGFDAAADAALPTDANAWQSQVQPPRAPHLPQLGRMQTTYLAAGDAVRPPPPPAVGSAAFQRALAEVRERTASGDPARIARAKRWEMTSGALVAGFWDEVATGLAAEHGLGGRDATRVLALTLGATLDANIACHDAKYAYWTPRPSQVDPSIQPTIGLPNHPSYPSNHACDSGAAADVLAALFPAHRKALQALAVDAAESRIDGGIHYRFDADAGLAIGRAAARAALQQAPAAAVALEGGR